MKFEIDLENSSLSEYFNEDNGDVTFTDAFKEKVISAFVRKMQWDSEIKNFVKDEIKEGLGRKIQEWKQDTAIKVVVEEQIKQDLSPLRSGSYFYAEEYKNNVKKATETALAQYVRKINALIETTIRNEVKKVMETLYKGHKMREFLDIDKLTAYVIQTMREPKESEETE